MKPLTQLLAVGGGGFSHQSDPLLEQVLVEMTGTHPPAVGYIGTANFDNFEGLSRFHRRFGELGANTLDLPTNATLRVAESWLSKLDILYVSGGNTRHLLSHWRTSGQDQLLVEAARAGLVLSGVSAGAVCWFEYALSDSIGKELQAIECLGIFKGSCCPHYNSEPARQAIFEQLIEEGHLPDGLAIDDGAAVLMRGNTPAGVYSARVGAGANHIRRIGGHLSSNRLRLL